MKKISSLCILFAALLCVVLFAAPQADAATCGGLTYTVSNGEVTITDCSTSATGDLAIPATIDGYPVTAIGGEAFEDCTSLTSITVPDSVTTIGDWAFSDCTSLTNITIPDSVTTIGSRAFYNCINLDYNVYDNGEYLGNANNPYVYLADTVIDRITQMAIHPNTKIIGYKAFYLCTSLTSITIPDGVTTIAEWAFEDCTSLTSVTIPDSVTNIGRAAFSDCTSLQYSIYDNGKYLGNANNPYVYLAKTVSGTITQILIHSNTKFIGYSAFEDCTSLTGITIPDSVTSIGNSAFYKCTGLTDITILDSVTTIGNYAFYSCTSLKDVYYSGTKVQWGDISVGSDNGSLTNATIHYNHIHDYTLFPAETVAPTCTTDGYTIYTCVYGETMKDNIVPALGHVPGSVANKLDATCTQQGYTEYICSRCQVQFQADYVDALGHDYTGPEKTVEATCTLDGHTGASCTRCDTVRQDTVLPALGHNAILIAVCDPTCTEKGVSKAGTQCERCKTYFVEPVWIPALGHSFTDYIPNNDATCFEDGTKTAKCNRCDVTDTVADTGSATNNHSFTNYITNNDATCVADGTKTAKCDRCGATDTIADTGSALGHQWDEGIYYPPTLKNEGYTLYTCLQCDGTRKLLDSMVGEILSQPASVTAETGDAVQFWVETQGVVVSYQWQYRKIYKWFGTSMEGFDTDTLTVPATGARNGYDYRCVITFADGTVLCSEPAKLTVNTSITGVQNPNDQTVALGCKGQFTASAEGEGVQYQWEYKRPDGERWIETAMEGASKPTVYIESTAARDSYQYRCRITDVTGKVVYTEPATMRVLSFKAQPEADVFAGLNENVQLTVSTSVPDGFTYQWQYRRSETGNWTNTTMAGYNTGTLTVATTKARNGYQYRCVLTGSKKSKLESGVTTLHCGDPAVIEDQSVNCTVKAGTTVQIIVAVTNVYSYQWQYARAGSETWYATSMEGAATANLKVQATTGRNGYRYRCIIKGLDGTEVISEPVTLTVK